MTYTEGVSSLVTTSTYLTHLTHIKALVIPAEAGIQSKVNWIPASAGMTVRNVGYLRENNMASNDYHFITTWRVKSTLEEISQIIGNGSDLPRWWPAVYLEAREVEPGNGEGVGKVIDLYTKGWLPYTLRWTFRVTESRYPFGFTLEAWGDFVGRGIWTFAPDGDNVKITYDWRIRADKWLLRKFSFMMKPIFAANHRWAMKKGQESLQLELRRRHAKSDAERALLPMPPQPTTTSPLLILSGAATALGAIIGIVYYSAKASHER